MGHGYQYNPTQVSSLSLYLSLSHTVSVEYTTVSFFLSSLIFNAGFDSNLSINILPNLYAVLFSTLTLTLGP